MTIHEPTPEDEAPAEAPAEEIVTTIEETDAPAELDEEAKEDEAPAEEAEAPDPERPPEG